MWRVIRKRLQSRKVTPHEDESGGQQSDKLQSLPTSEECGAEVGDEVAVERKRGCLGFLRRRKRQILPTIVEESSSQGLLEPQSPLKEKRSRVRTAKSVLQSILRFPLKRCRGHTDLRITTDEETAEGQESDSVNDVTPTLEPVQNDPDEYQTGENLPQVSQSELEPEAPEDRPPSTRPKISFAKEDSVLFIQPREPRAVVAPPPQSEKNQMPQSDIDRTL